MATGQAMAPQAERKDGDREMMKKVRAYSISEEAISREAERVGGDPAKIERIRPKVLAINGKRAAKAFCGHQIGYGQQPEPLGKTIIFVLPSTSGAARRYWDETYWMAMSDSVGALHAKRDYYRD